MKRFLKYVKDSLLTLFILALSFILSSLLHELCNTPSLAPLLFVLAVFIVSLTTKGYIYGIAASMLSVLAVNYAFAFPYFKFDFLNPVNLLSAVVMLCVAVVTSALTTKLKLQERIKADSEKEKMRADLLRAVSHDLRTPLTSIYGSCSAIIDNYCLLGKQKKLKLLGEIRDDSEWLIRMVENLLSITKIDGENVSVIKTPIVVEELVDDVLVKFRKMYPGQSIETEIPEDFISIPMDALLIEQVIINLLENAVLHAYGMTTLFFRVYTTDSRAVFEISDDGCGIPEEKLKTIFTGNIRSVNVPSDNKRNMGVGLSVCAAIIKAHGGVIQAKCRKGGGSVFSFWLGMEDKANE